MDCPRCGRRFYPRINPAVIVGVTNGDRLLLTRYAGRSVTWHALVAGFVEIGETLEETIAREGRFWLLAGLLFCQNAAEYSVNGWLVTYYREQGILQGIYSSYCITVMWGATLITRLLIAFVFPLKNRWKALAWMGAATAVLYVFLVCTKTPLSALAFLFLFACAIAGVNPAVTAGIGDAMSPKSVGILLPAGSIGGILMPQVIGICADALGLQAGMLINLIPCAGIAVLSLVMLARKNREA